MSRSRGARRSFARRDFKSALSWYQKQKPPARDRLLYLMDQGVILHTAGQFQESLKIFAQAIELSEEMEGHHVVSQTASIVTNDNYIPYQGEKFESLLLHVFQVLNYLQLDQGDEALVEVRRIHTKFSDFFKKEAKDYLQNAFASYLSGLVWESRGKFNDAYIDYKTTYRLQPTFPPLPQKLLQGANYLGFLNDSSRWKKRVHQPLAVSPKDGEIIFIIEEGEVPEKESTEEQSDLQIVPVPHYPDPLGTPVKVQVSSKGVTTESTTLFRVDEVAQKTLKDQMPAIIARAVARLAAKETGAVMVGKNVDEDLGVLVGLLVLATNRADLRSWLTLPRSFQTAQLSLPAGTYDFTLTWPGGSHQFKDVEVKARGKKFITYRIF
ncbi:MAG: hypothetical protein HY073_05445 [Deltaproteobacteria bacterium]|nr:hypothetical protein [Deltaproteobacteria bacterium]